MQTFNGGFKVRQNREPLLPAKLFLEKAATLSKREVEQLNLRTRRRFTLRREDSRYTPIEVVALQLEFEDAMLRNWRKQLDGIRLAARASRTTQSASVQ
jgi:hypothetical protein